jgi:septum site-determining protein MinD
MITLCKELAKEFDYILIDCPAGIEQGFKNAVAGADRAIIITTPEVSAVRDADRIIGLLESHEIKDTRLIINRIKMNMVKRGDMLSIEDVIDLLAVELIGVVPDDEKIQSTTNRGEPVINEEKSPAGLAYRNISKRILGENVPLMLLDGRKGFFDRIKKVFSGKGIINV